ANAFHHSRARSVEIEIGYSSEGLRMRIRDNGCGIDPAILESGRSGHWGLQGMRERAEHVGATITLWSRQGLGTEVDLLVPARVSFEQPSSPQDRRAPDGAARPATVSGAMSNWVR